MDPIILPSCIDSIHDISSESDCDTPESHSSIIIRAIKTEDYDWLDITYSFDDWKTAEQFTTKIDEWGRYMREHQDTVLVLQHNKYTAPCFPGSDESSYPYLVAFRDTVSMIPAYATLQVVQALVRRASGQCHKCRQRKLGSYTCPCGFTMCMECDPSLSPCHHFKMFK